MQCIRAVCPRPERYDTPKRRNLSNRNLSNQDSSSGTSSAANSATCRNGKEINTTGLRRPRRAAHCAPGIGINSPAEAPSDGDRISEWKNEESERHSGTPLLTYHTGLASLDSLILSFCILSAQTIIHIGGSIVVACHVGIKTRQPQLRSFGHCRNFTPVSPPRHP